MTENVCHLIDIMCDEVVHLLRAARVAAAFNVIETKCLRSFYDSVHNEDRIKSLFDRNLLYALEQNVNIYPIHISG